MSKSFDTFFLSAPFCVLDLYTLKKKGDKTTPTEEKEEEEEEEEERFEE